MTEVGTLITISGLTASVLAPACVAYAVVNLRRHIAEGRWLMVGLGVLALIQCIGTAIYFALMWRVMSRAGLGV